MGGASDTFSKVPHVDSNMLESIAKYLKDVSVLRRLLFAVSYLPPDLQNIWGVAIEFATRGKESRNCISPEQAQLFFKHLMPLLLKLMTAFFQS